MTSLAAAVGTARRIAGQPTLATYVEEEVLPGPLVRNESELRANLIESVTSADHVVGTCQMGLSGRSVVDERLRVHGIGGLRVVDASIMPTIVGANTNAPAIMIGEKGAAMIAADSYAS